VGYLNKFAVLLCAHIQVLVWVFVGHIEMIGLFEWFVNDGWALSWLGGGGRNGGIFEKFLSEDRVKFRSKFSAKLWFLIQAD
jgi:hypothetical protein